MSLALFSIHPEYTDLILSGTKKVEFRKVRPKKAISCIVIYSTSPTSKVVGLAKIKHVEGGSPQDIWRKFEKVGGISHEAYLSYFDGKDVAYALVIDKVFKLESPLCLADLDKELKPPQSFIYIDSSLEEFCETYITAHFE
ncbi:MAG: ASCH domain-containing protein [Fimbriimonadaceae bacterium]